MVFVPLVGLFLFSISISVSAAMYPGGNRFNAQFDGYSFFGNYLCDLFHPIAYNGLPNAGRTYALFGTYTLALTLLLFWILVPRLFANQIQHRRVVWVFGVSAMITSLLIATPLHDWCIIVAVPLGLIAFMTTILGLQKNAHRSLAGLGLASMLMCAINYFALIFKAYPPMLPGLQKFTLILFLGWIITSSTKLIKL